jgi:tetratricopeptide (TPR) repeat protein
MRAVVCLLLAISLGGCAGEKVKERPPRAQQVIDLGQQGQVAYSKGDLPRAARLFDRALTDAMRIEYSEGVAIMSINLARVTRETGDSAGALKLLDAVSPWHRSNIAARTAQEMDLLVAVLLTDVKRRDEALTRLLALRERCNAACETAIGIDSLQARVLLEKDDAASAVQVAGAAIDRFRAHGNQLEVANLFRVQGEAYLALGNFPAARQSMENALSIDKSLSQPAKIEQDLEALVRYAMAAKDMAAHAGYLARLEEVRLARKGKTAR